MLAGFVLGVSKHGRPLVPRARELFIPAGLILLFMMFWWRRRRVPEHSTLWLGMGRRQNGSLSIASADSKAWQPIAGNS
ncbi:MAG: hypothetical protein ACXVVQ_08895 [Solirubrobacteraceae bacterium]